MDKRKPKQNDFIRAVKKFFLSAFVVITFIAYALENRAAEAAGKVGLGAPVSSGNGASPESQAQGSPGNDGPAFPAPTQAPAAATPTVTSPPPQLVFGPAPTATSNPSGQTAQNGQYKDGTYTGPEVDVNWGLVQVQAVVQNGKITNVQFLEYPRDRRTSQRINFIAMPALQQEAIQAQSANVDLISGATLTSEGFQMSLQEALTQAKRS